MNIMTDHYRVNRAVKGPRVTVVELNNRFGGAINALLDGDFSDEIKMPYWVVVGREAFLVTAENHEALALGMVLGMSGTAFFSKRNRQAAKTKK